MKEDIRIAAVTMQRGDEFFLAKWVEYYGSQLGKENLYIFFDGLDQTIPAFCDGTNASLNPRIQAKIANSDKQRIAFLSRQASRLLKEEGYNYVIGADADEFLVVDPKLGLSLKEYIARSNVRTTLSGLGLDFGQKLGEEGDITSDVPFLQQRHYAQLCTRYTKASVIAKPLRWGSGFHRVKGHNFHIGKDLYLLHFGYSDLKRIQDRMADTCRLDQGWEKHMKRRSRTISYVTHLKARDFDRWTAIARRCQSLVRPPYALNKPAMFEARIVVKVPERFHSVV